MERLHGQGFYKLLKLETKLNRWGVSEPTAASLAGADSAARTSDSKCRAANDIEGEPRP